MVKSLSIGKSAAKFLIFNKMAYNEMTNKGGDIIMGAKRFSDEQEKQIVDEYKNGATTHQLMEKYGFKTHKSITDKIKKHYPNQYKEILEIAKQNQKGYYYTLDKVVSEFDAYFLGLLLTDGYVNITKPGSTKKRNQVGIDLIDEDCIKFLSKAIGKSYSCYQPYQINDFNQQPRYRLILEDGKLVNNLQRLGVVPNKSKILQGPKLLSEEIKFVPYIIRGIIDGDGTVSPTSYGGPQFSIVSASFDFINWIKDVLTNYMYMKDIRITAKEDNRSANYSTLYTIGSADIDNIQKLIALSYNKPFGMMRKYELIRKTFRDYNQDNVIL